MASTTLFRNEISGLSAGLTLAAKQYHAVKFASTAGSVIVAAAATDNIVSIVQNDPTAGQPALLPGPGDVCKAVAGKSDIVAGEWLTSNTTGQLSDSTTANNKIIAQALQASTAVGDIISVQIAKFNY